MWKNARAAELAPTIIPAYAGVEPGDFMTATSIAAWLVGVAAAYGAVGFVFSIPFVLCGAGKIDPVAREGTWGFRLLIVSGAIALWPLLLKRWLSGVREPPAECNAHRRAARAREHRPT